MEQRWLERRQFLSWVLSVSALTAAGTLAGCGSGNGTTPVPGGFGPVGSGTNNNGNSGGTTSVRTVTTKLVLPSGFALPLTSLTAQTGLSAPTVVQASGAAALAVSDGQNASPTLAWVRSGDDVLMLGFITPDSAALSAQSTAVALLYLALAGFSLPAESKKQVLDAIASDAALSPLVQTLESRLAVNPRALPQGDTEIGAALSAALQAVGANVNRAVQASANKTPHAAATAHRDRALDALLLVQPTTLQSNVEVLQAPDAGQSVIATNHSRRYCQVLTYQTGFTDKDGNRTDYPQAKAVGNGSGVPLPATTALGVFSTVKNFVSGQTAFVPVSSPPIALEMATNAAQTYYDVIVLGASSLVFDPAFYSDPKYAPFVAGWRNIQGRQNLKSWLVDVVLGLLLEIWGLRDIAKNDAAIEAAVTAFRNEELIVTLGIYEYVLKGDLLKATRNFIAGFGDSPNLAIRVRALLAAAFPTIGGLSVPAAEAAAGAQVVIKTALAALNAAGAVLGAGDLGAVLYDLANAEPGNKWSATLVERVVRLSPSSAKITRGGSQLFTATIPEGNAPGANIIYLWEVTGSDLATLTDATTGKSAKQLETASKTVTLATTPSTQGTLTVSVTATVTGSDGIVSNLGDAQAKVEFTQTQRVPGTRETYFRWIDQASGFREVAILVRFTPDPQAKRYVLHGSGSYVPFFAKSEIHQPFENPNWTNRDGTVIAGAAFVSGAYGSSSDPTGARALWESLAADWTWEVEMIYTTNAFG